MTKFIDYEDVELKMRIPVYMHPKAGIRHFVLNRGSKKEAQIFALGVNLTNKQGAEAIQFNLMNVKLFDSANISRKFVRRGVCSYLPNSVEALGCDLDRLTKAMVFDYELVFKSEDDCFVHVRAGGKCNLEEFDKVCKEIVQSIKLKPTS